jgi:hypothetical protein
MAVAMALLAGQTPGVESPAEAPPATASPYPLEIRAPFDVGLFHWVDSLAGTSGGKTIPVYQEEFQKRFGDPSATDLAVLRSFRRARARHAGSRTGPSNGSPKRGSSAMLQAFLEEGSLVGAVTLLAGQLPEPETVALKRALGHFQPRYRVLWDEATYMLKFLEKLDQPSQRQPIEQFLAEMARFLGVSPTAPPRPRLVFVPVPRGGGTHAQAVERNLLLEIRPGDSPLDQISVIAHENAHFLIDRIPEKRARRLEAAAVNAAPEGEEVWRLLREGLPTALGQGVARYRLQPRQFSETGNWYHIDDVDRLAKRIFPVVERAMDKGRTLDEDLVARLVTAHSN